MFSATEVSLAWAAEVLGVRAVTYPPEGSRELAAFCVVERTGGALDYPHDRPDMTFQVWAKSESEAESLAHCLAVAARTMPMGDPHVNAMGVPEVMSYGREDGGWFVWQATVQLEVNLLD